MVKKISKEKAIKEIEEFFSNEDFKNKTQKEIKKIKRLAMKHNIALKEKRKLFCKNCLNPFFESSIKIKNDFLIIACEHCGYKSRWRVK